MQEDVSTRERIKRAARHLFALNGVDVAVREVIAAAGQKNASALNYYFGSKEGLIETLIGDALAIADARWDAALDALEAVGGPRTIREVVELLVLRGLPPNAPEGDEASARFLAMVLQTRRDLVRAATARRGLTAYNRALRHIRRLMPAHAGAGAGSAAAVLFLGLDRGARPARSRRQARRRLRAAVEWAGPAAQFHRRDGRHVRGAVDGAGGQSS